MHQIQICKIAGGWRLHCQCHHRPILEVPDSWDLVIAMEEVGQFLADHDASTRQCEEVIGKLFPMTELDELVDRLEQNVSTRGVELGLALGYA